MSALADILKAPFAGTGVIIHDGQWTTEETAGNLIIVGWTGFVPSYQLPHESMNTTTQAPAATSTAVQEGLGPSLREVLTIQCGALCLKGANIIRDARMACYDNVTRVGQIVALNSTLNDTVMKSTMGAATSLHEMKIRRGTLIAVGFSIECETYSQQ